MSYMTNGTWEIRRRQSTNSVHQTNGTELKVAQHAADTNVNCGLPTDYCRSLGCQRRNILKREETPGAEHVQRKSIDRQIKHTKFSRVWAAKPDGAASAIFPHAIGKQASSPWRQVCMRNGYCKYCTCSLAMVGHRFRAYACMARASRSGCMRCDHELQLDGGCLY